MEKIRSKEIFKKLKYTKGLTAPEIADDLKMTSERVWRILEIFEEQGWTEKILGEGCLSQEAWRKKICIERIIDKIADEQVLTIKILNLIEELIRSKDNGDEKIEANIYELCSNKRGILSKIALNEHILINVRAMAARLFMANTDSAESFYSDQLINHKSDLIRLGVIYGLEDAGRFKEIENFTKDSCEKVRETAENILAERNF